MRLLLLMLVVYVAPVFAQGGNPSPSKDLGAKVYVERCVLCHGESGMGEGILPLKLKAYPNTNFFKDPKATDRSQVYLAIVYGGYLPGYDDAMPPYGQELTWTELEAVVDFILLLRNNPKEAQALVNSHQISKSPRAQLGKQVFDTRCVLCHGKFGEGDGRMGKVIKDPPPYDLTASRVPDEYLKEIIMRGGEAMGRSKHMPPWGDQLTPNELKVLIEYLKSIRD